MKLIDIIGIALIAIGLLLTVTALILARPPTFKVLSTTIQEIQPNGPGTGI